MIENNQGLLVRDGQTVGYLFDFTGKGIFSPDGGVDISKEVAQKHNEILSQAEILGLDKCEIGQWGTFFYVKGRVQT